MAAKVVVFPGNATIIAGSDINFAVRAAEGKLPANFMPKWHMIAPKNDSSKSAQDSQIDASGQANFTKEGEYHIQALIPGIAKEESFAFISGLGKVATGASLLKPANFDIVFLVLLFGLSMFISQKLTVPAPKLADGQELDEQQIIQQQTMKTMPLVTTAMFFFFPIPAGVYLYLVVSNIMQTFQTWLITRTPEPEFGNDEDEDVIIVAAAPKNGGGATAQPNKKTPVKTPVKKNKRKK